MASPELAEKLAKRLQSTVVVEEDKKEGIEAPPPAPVIPQKVVENPYVEKSDTSIDDLIFKALEKREENNNNHAQPVKSQPLKIDTKSDESSNTPQTIDPRSPPPKVSILDLLEKERQINEAVQQSAPTPKTPVMVISKGAFPRSSSPRRQQFIRENEDGNELEKKLAAQRMKKYTEELELAKSNDVLDALMNLPYKSPLPPPPVPAASSASSASSDPTAPTPATHTSIAPVRSVESIEEEDRRRKESEETKAFEALEEEVERMSRSPIPPPPTFTIPPPPTMSPPPAPRDSPPPSPRPTSVPPPVPTGVVAEGVKEPLPSPPQETLPEASSDALPPPPSIPPPPVPAHRKSEERFDLPDPPPEVPKKENFPTPPANLSSLAVIPEASEEVQESSTTPSEVVLKTSDVPLVAPKLPVPPPKPETPLAARRVPTAQLIEMIQIEDGTRSPSGSRPQSPVVGKKTSLSSIGLMCDQDLSLEKSMPSPPPVVSPKPILAKIVDEKELNDALERRNKILEGESVPLKLNTKVSLYAEFTEFTRKQIQYFTETFRKYDEDNDNYIDFEELKRMMEKLGEAQTHIALKELIRKVDEDKDGKISQREFLLIFRLAASGELSCSEVFTTLAQSVDVSKEGVLGAANFFQAKIEEQTKLSKFEEEMREEKEERRREEEEKKARRDKFLASKSIFH